VHNYLANGKDDRRQIPLAIRRAGVTGNSKALNQETREENDPKVWPWSIRFWNEIDAPTEAALLSFVLGDYR
jgi:hypothetical protein